MVDTQEKFITKSEEVHSSKYEYSLVKYKNTGTKVQIICKIHGVFHQSPMKHLAGQGCPKCRGTRIAASKKMSNEEFVKKARIVHGDLYSYENVNYVNMHTKVLITCSKHGDFSQTPNNHLWDNNGCPPCKNNCISKSANKWLDSLGTDLIREYNIPSTNYKVDGFDSKTNTVYEYLGKFWHGDLEKYNPEDINPVNKVKYKELNRLTMERIGIIENLGYKVVYIYGESSYERTLSLISLKDVSLTSLPFSNTTVNRPESSSSAEHWSLTFICPSSSYTRTLPFNDFLSPLSVIGSLNISRDSPLTSP